jgi:hypothetical protein
VLIPRSRSPNDYLYDQETEVKLRFTDALCSRGSNKNYIIIITIIITTIIITTIIIINVTLLSTS